MESSQLVSADDPSLGHGWGGGGTGGDAEAAENMVKADAGEDMVHPLPPGICLCEVCEVCNAKVQVKQKATEPQSESQVCNAIKLHF